MKHFTKEEDNFLTNNYLTISKCAMANSIDRKTSSVVSRLKALKLIVPVDVAESFRKAVVFKAGHITKIGKQRNSKLSAKLFTKTLWMSRNGKLYYWIKTEEGWIQYHIWLWKKAGYEIEPGSIVAFKNGNTLKPFLSNLECITRAENLKRNQVNWSNKRHEKSLKQRRKEKYKSSKKQMIADRKKIKKQELHKQKHITDDVNWSKKYLAKQVIKIADTSNLKPLRIDNKTTLYLKPGADVQAILKQYQRKAS